MMCSLRAISCAAFAGAAIGASAFGAPLYGVTEIDSATDTAQLVEIDPATGSATPLFTFGVPAGYQASRLAFHDTSGALFMLSRAVTGAPDFQLTRIKIQAQSASTFPITGLPVNTAAVEGLGFDASTGKLLVSHGTSVATQFIAEVSQGGAVVTTSSLIVGTLDLDNLEYDDFNGRLTGADFNRADTPRVFQVNDPLGFPSVTGLFSPPSNNDVGDVAIDPETGTFYTTTFGALAGNLTRVETNQYVTVGPYDLDANVVGVAFGPSPGGVGLAVLGGLVGLRRRR